MKKNYDDDIQWYLLCCLGCLAKPPFRKFLKTLPSNFYLIKIDSFLPFV